MVIKRASYQLMPDRIKLKSQDLVKWLADTVLHSEVICIKLHVRYNAKQKGVWMMYICNLDSSVYYILWI